MAPKKPELLDLLRKQRAAELHGSTERKESARPTDKADTEGRAGKAEQPAKAARPELPPPPRSAPPAPAAGATPPVRATARPPRHPAKMGERSQRLPWLGLLVLVAVAVPLVWWLSGLLRQAPIEAGASALTPAAGEEPAATPPAAPARYGVVAITYQRSERNLKDAYRVGQDIVNLLGTPGEVPDLDPVQVFVGSAGASNQPELLALRDRVRELEYPAGSGKRPFGDAYISRIPLVRTE